MPSPCPYCGDDMPNPRRVQCGKPECKRRWHSLRVGAYLKERRQSDPEYGRPEKVERICPCGAVDMVRPEHRNNTCPSCGSAVGGRAGAAALWRGHVLQTADERREVRRAYKPEERARAKQLRIKRGVQWAYVQLPPEMRRARQQARRADRSRRRRARLRGAETVPFRAIDIYERDDWTCQICRDLLDPDEQVPHPLAPTIDHVFPLARGGAHAPDNVQAAHFLCNARKRDLVVC